MPDELPYPSRVIDATHPDRLAVLARLFGIHAAPPTRCRLLEIGCGTGVNLVSIASGLPGAELVGIDTSPEHVACAADHVRALGLRNVTVSARSILDVGKDDGVFDYVVCHGVFSWVGEDVQKKILDVCRESLAPNGIAFVSYNTYPGWHVREMARDMMRFHVSASAARGEARVDEAVRFLALLRDEAGGAKTTHGKILDDELTSLRASHAGYVAHEHLAEHNHPIYFHELAARARAAGLAYVVDAELAMTLPESFAPNVRKLVDAALSAGDRVRAEQYIDFVSNRHFRGSLLCHQATAGALDLAMGGDVFEGRALTAACATGASKQARDLSATPVSFEAAGGRRAQLSDPLAKLALATLIARAPEAIDLDALVREVETKVRASANAAALEPRFATFRADLRTQLLQLFKYGFVRLRGYAPPLATRPSERPVAHGLARREIGSDAVPNAWHESITLDPLERLLLPELDGTRDLAALAETTKTSTLQVAAALERLARAGLLIG